MGTKGGEDFIGDVGNGGGNFILWVNMWSQVKQLPGVALHCVHARLCHCKGHMAEAQKDRQINTP